MDLPTPYSVTTVKYTANCIEVTIIDAPPENPPIVKLCECGCGEEESDDESDEEDHTVDDANWNYYMNQAKAENKLFDYTRYYYNKKGVQQHWGFGYKFCKDDPDGDNINKIK
jgi:hypothetical protein